MEPSTRYCEYCGNPIGVQARFCGRCGKPVSPPVIAAVSTPAPVPPVVPVPPAAQAAPMTAAPVQAEPVIGVIPWAMRRTGTLGLKIENYTIVLTPQRMIFALLTNQMRSENIQRAQQEAKSAGKNAFQQLGARMSADNGAAYYNKTPAEIMAENPANFYVLNQQVQKARITSYDDGDGGVTTYSLELNGGFGKIKFELGRLNEREARNFLSQALGPAFK